MEKLSIGTRIKQRRKELGLKQLQIKELTGISSGNLSEIENNKIQIFAKRLNILYKNEQLYSTNKQAKSLTFLCNSNRIIHVINNRYGKNL